jgi:hypothetical protein
MSPTSITGIVFIHISRILTLITPVYRRKYSKYWISGSIWGLMVSVWMQFPICIKESKPIVKIFPRHMHFLKNSGHTLIPNTQENCYLPKQICGRKIQRPILEKVMNAI